MQRMPEIFTSLHPLTVQQTNVGLGILWEVTTLLVLLLTRCLGNNVSRRWRGHGGHAWIAAIMHVSRRWRVMASLCVTSIHCLITIAVAAMAVMHGLRRLCM